MNSVSKLKKKSVCSGLVSRERKMEKKKSDFQLLQEAGQRKPRETLYPLSQRCVVNKA